jgi:hypothetical protein
MIALVYLLCVLAPTLSFALPGSQVSPYCLTDGDRAPGVVHVHHESIAPADQDVHALHHSSVQIQADPSVDHVVNPAGLEESDSTPAKAPHATDGKCCGLMCVTALPAPFIVMAQPSVPKAVKVSDNHRKLTDNTRPRLYRPPNS